ncbi:MAG: hypothetical protein EOL97_14535 [Spirochaetia bacterium]|nr:hypothetical protein [Spirochaetia bacterium]
MKHKLTMEMLENAEPNSVLFQGEIEDSPNGFYINGTKKMLKYVVCRGGVPDWCIYAEDCYRDMSFEEVKRVGHKVLKETAKVVIEADKEVFGWYRE